MKRFYLKITNLTACLIFLIACFALIIFSQTKENKSSGSDELTLDKTQLFLPCPPETRNNFKCSPGTKIKVKSNFHNLDEKPKYDYSVSGGIINGNGKEVEWDLSSLRPGTYSISVTVTDARGVNKTLSKSISLSECGTCISDCLDCPEISILSSAEEIKEGKEVVFIVNVAGGNSDSEFTYNWKVSNGKIIEGQGTPKVKVRANKSAGKDLTVTFKIDGTCPDCQKIFIKIIKIVSKK